LACFRDRLGAVEISTTHDRLSWTCLLLQRPTIRSCRPSRRHPKTTTFKLAPFLRFPAPSTHQVWEVHLHGLPYPLSSAYVVSSTLTVCSLPDPAGLFHPAAFMAFRGSYLQFGPAEASPIRPQPPVPFGISPNRPHLAASCVPSPVPANAAQRTSKSGSQQAPEPLHPQKRDSSIGSPPSASERSEERVQSGLHPTWGLFHTI